MTKAEYLRRTSVVLALVVLLAICAVTLPARVMWLIAVYPY